MVRRSDYNQLGIGDCGHVVGTWPLITNFRGGNRRVFCDKCGGVLVGLKKKELHPTLTRPRKPNVKKSAKPKSPFLTLLQEEGL